MRTTAGSAADIQATAVGGYMAVAVMAFMTAAGVVATCLRFASDTHHR